MFQAADRAWDSDEVLRSCHTEPCNNLLQAAAPERVAATLPIRFLSVEDALARRVSHAPLRLVDEAFHIQRGEVSHCAAGTMRLGWDRSSSSQQLPTCLKSARFNSPVQIAEVIACSILGELSRKAIIRHPSEVLNWFLLCSDGAARHPQTIAPKVPCRRGSSRFIGAWPPGRLRR